MAMHTSGRGRQKWLILGLIGVIVVLLFSCLLATWIHYFGKSVSGCNGVTIKKVAESEGKLRLWYLYSVESLDEKNGVDIDRHARELRLRFVVTHQPWPFADVDERATWDKSEHALLVTLTVTDAQRVVAVCPEGDDVLIWPRVEPIPHGGALLSELGPRQGRKEDTSNY